MTRTYELMEDGIFRTDEKGNVSQLSNFQAWITCQRTLTDGVNTSTLIDVTGKIGDKQLPTVQVKAENFHQMTWVPKLWGIHTIIFPIPNAERDLATAIQTLSDPQFKTVYTHTGWTTDDQPKYIHAKGAITKNGPTANEEVSLQRDLRNYYFEPQPKAYAQSIQALLALTQLTHRKFTWTLLTAAIRPIFQTTDFGIHIAGKTGSFKSELASLFQSCYGTAMDARHLPTGWNATANALEALAYSAKDAVMTIDDFVPHGTQSQVRGLTAKADTIFRAQGNQAGRARMTDTAKINETYYPRGLILSTGEDIPEGHSLRGRIIIIDLNPDDIPAEKLTIAQKNRPHYQNATAAIIQAQAAAPTDHTTFRQMVDATRPDYQGMGHARTPDILAQLQVTGQLFLMTASIYKAIDKHQKRKLYDELIDSLHEIGQQQAQYIESEDVPQTLLQTITELFATRAAHAKTVEGGIPQNATEAGWEKEGGENGQMASYTKKGPTIAWIDWRADMVYLSADHITWIASKARGRLAHTKATIIKRLADAGLIARKDASRQRNTIRKKCEGTQRNLVALPMDALFEQQEE